VRGSLRTAVLELRTAQRLVRTNRAPLRERFGPLDDRLVFVLGSPRSGTTFLARSIGSAPGFVDLGEVAPLKAAIPTLAALPPAEAGRRIRRILDVTRRLGLVGSVRAVEQTPETAFVADAIAAALPRARLVHIVRDGRDVACSLLERGWLSAGRTGTDDAGLPYGTRPRFWVERDRRAAFAGASDARRAAWAWRRYVTAARAGPAERLHEVRYERLAEDPEGTAADLAEALGAPMRPLAEALGAAHASSIGRFRAELTPEQLTDVEEEAGPLLRELGYEPA
jgi:Sulfotransferase family